MSRRARLAVAMSVAAVALSSLVFAGCGGSSSSETDGSPEARPGQTKCAWALGGGGTIMATADGGAKWIMQESGTRYGLSDLCFADASHGWVVGGLSINPAYPGPRETATLVLATTDGGKRWTTVLETAGEPLGAVACADASHVWAAAAGPPAGGTAKILASSDGGQTWTTQYADDSVGAVADMTFADRSRGWAVCNTGDVLATTDGGSHWQVQTTLRGETDWGIAFADASHGWVVGSRYTSISGPGGSLARVWTTGDAGETWKAAPPPEGHVADLMAVTCTDTSHVWTGGGGDPVLFRSTNGGLDWRAASTSIKVAAVSAIAFSDSSHGWAVTMNGHDYGIIATTDGGVTWSRQASASGSQFFKNIACPPPTGSADH